MSRHHIKIWSKSLIWILAVTAFPAYSFIHYQIKNSNGISIDDFFKSDEISTKKVDETKTIKKTIPGDSTKKTVKSDTGELKYPIKQNDDRNKSDYDNNIDLLDPSVKTYFEYNSKTGMYDEYKEQAGKKTLLILPDYDNNVFLSGRNIPKTSITTADEVNTYDLINAEILLISETAVSKLENLLNK